MRPTIATLSATILLTFGGILAYGTQASAIAKTIRSTDCKSGIQHCQAPAGAKTCHEIRATYKMRNSNDVVMYLCGTTPVKNWQMKAHGLQGEAQFVLSNHNALVAIESLNFSLPVRNLKGEVDAMDQDAYTALKADRYKNIIFTLDAAKVAESSDHSYVIQALGKLSVAGVTRTVTLIMHSKMSPDGSIAFSGSESLKMSDYNVERPSVLFGVIKAADEMTLTYSLIFSK